MRFSDFIKSIPKIKNTKSGGVVAQFKLAPEYRKPHEAASINKNTAIKAAVIILLFPDSKGNTSFVLIQRADYKGHHAQQISFPGGKKENQDQSLIKTAIRETFEEIGVLVNKNQIIKKLTEVYIPPSNFIVQPYIAYLSQTPTFTPNYEVANIITPSLIQLFKSDVCKITQIKASNGIWFDTPYYDLNNNMVWGATAMMLSEFKELLISIGIPY